jgi:hypothetical protein
MTTSLTSLLRANAPRSDVAITTSFHLGFAGALRATATAIALSVLAACGGGGGSGSLDPTADAAAETSGTSEKPTIVGETSASAASTVPTVSRSGGAATSAPVQRDTINSLDTVVSDMKLRNDLPLAGYESQTVGWYVGPGYVQMGNQPRTSNMPQWFKSAYPWMINDEPLRALLPWIVLFDAPGHAATNTRVQFRNLRAYYLSRSTGQWRSIGVSPGVSGFATPKQGLFGGSIGEDKRKNDDGSVEVKPPSDRNLAWHGWWDLGRVPIDASDIGAMFVTVQGRLVVDDPSRPDDRDRARLLFHVGADYYVDSATAWTVPQPGVGLSRAKRVTNEWQAYSMTTFSDVGIQEPGGGISEAAFRANPPPLE